MHYLLSDTHRLAYHKWKRTNHSPCWMRLRLNRRRLKPLPKPGTPCCCLSLLLDGFILAEFDFLIFGDFLASTSLLFTCA